MPFVKAMPPPTDWTIEAGARYGISTGRKAQDLYNVPGSDLLLSRLTFSGLVSHALEGFARFDHRDGVFVKGNFGLGSLAGGQFHDEDFPPGTVPYSNTAQVSRDGQMRFGSGRRRARHP
jgi:hypothetical protein